MLEHHAGASANRREERLLTAITREVSPRLAECEVSGERVPIDVSRAVQQHAGYLAALEQLGARVVTLPALADQPDCVFVEDPALVLDEVAVIARMGAASRRGESESLAGAVGQYRDLLRIEAPGTLEGGDVMRIGKTLYAGLSRRTNVAGIQQLAQLVHPYGYWVTPVEIRECLHLKSACCFVGPDAAGDDRVLVNRAWIDEDAMCGWKPLEVDPGEPHAANVLRIDETVLMPSAFPRTRDRLEAAGFRVRAIDTSELMKADAGVTCMSLVFDSDR